MNKMNFKSKFSLFSKHNAHKSIDADISPKDAINQNAIWFQSMEPISYAKNQTKELYEINDTNILMRLTQKFLGISYLKF